MQAPRRSLVPGVPAVGAAMPGDRPEQWPPRRFVAAAPGMEQLDLDRVHRIDIRVTQADRPLHDRVAVEELVRLDDRQHRGHRSPVLGRQRLPESLPIVSCRHERDVRLRDLEARLRERHLEVLHERAEERPFGVEPPQPGEPLALEPYAAKAAPQPYQAGRRQRFCVQANTQGIARSASSSPVAAASGREAGRDPIFSSASSSTGVKLRKNAGKADRPRPGPGASMAPRRPARPSCPGRRRSVVRARRRQGTRSAPSPRRPPRGSVPRARKPVLERDRLALLGQLQATVDGAARLREDAGMGRAAAPARRAAAPVEDRQRDATVSGDPRQLLLRAIDLPLGCRDSRRPCPSPSSPPSPRARAAGCGRGSPPRAGRPPAGRRSSRAAARPATRRRLLGRGASAARTSSAVRVIETISRSTPAAPCLACAAAAATSVSRIRSSGAWIAEACTRRSSFAR